MALRPTTTNEKFNLYLMLLWQFGRLGQLSQRPGFQSTDTTDATGSTGSTGYFRIKLNLLRCYLIILVNSISSIGHILSQSRQADHRHHFPNDSKHTQWPWFVPFQFSFTLSLGDFSSRSSLTISIQKMKIILLKSFKNFSCSQRRSISGRFIRRMIATI